MPVSPFRDLNLGGLITLDGVQQLYILGALSIVLGIYTYSHKVMRTVGKDLFQLSPVTALVALMAEAIVLFLFASRGLYNLLLSLGLPTIPLVPVSSTQVIVGSVMGIAIAKGGKNLRYNILGRISLAWVTAPLLAFFFSFIALFIIQNVFEQTVYQQLQYTFNRATIQEITRSGYDNSALATVNGRSFDSERAVYTELNSQHHYSRKDLIGIIGITEQYPLEVKTEVLTAKGLHKRFTPAQWEALLKLEEQRYKHKWQLRDALIADPAWTLHEAPQTEQQKNHNRGIEAKLDILYRAFYSPPKGKI